MQRRSDLYKTIIGRFPQLNAQLSTYFVCYMSGGLKRGCHTFGWTTLIQKAKQKNSIRVGQL